jgi:hypothetical protein
MFTVKLMSSAHIKCLLVMPTLPEKLDCGTASHDWRDAKYPTLQVRVYIRRMPWSFPITALNWVPK